MYGAQIPWQMFDQVLSLEHTGAGLSWFYIYHNTLIHISPDPDFNSDHHSDPNDQPDP